LTLDSSAAYTAGMSQVLAALAIPLIVAGSSAFLSSEQDQKPQRPSESRTRSVYVSVLDSSGKSVQGLTAADFVVREDGTAREVLKAGPAGDPIAIAVTTDDTQAATATVQFIRDALKSFVRKLDGKAVIALSTFGERPTPLVEYTESTAQLEKGITRIFAKSGAGAYLLEALVELSRGIERREEPRKAIVVLTVEAGSEFSTQYHRPVVEAIRRSGAVLHVLAIGSPSPSDTDEARNRNIVIAEGTELTGGRRDQVLAESGLTDRLNQLADELLNQYVVSYSRPETLIPPEKLDVSVSKPGLTVRAPKRFPGK
jgi:VWFA-related protein